MKVKKKKPLKAIAVHAFAGGITQGVMEAGFDVLRAYEPLGFGVETQRQKLGLEVVVEPDFTKWEPHDGVDLVFGNPRCGGFSGLGSNTASEDMRGSGCRQSIDAEQLCRFGVACDAKVIMWESVQMAMTGVGAGFVQRMHEEVLHEYRIVHVFMNTATFGNAQYRRRWFMVAYRDDLVFNPIVPTPPKIMVTVGKVLAPLTKYDGRAEPARYNRKGAEYHADSYQRVRDDDWRLIPLLPAGGSLNHFHHEHGPAFFKKHGHLSGYEVSKNARSPTPFGVAHNRILRLKLDGPCPSLVGNCCNWVHPLHDRTLTVRELAALMGWRRDVIPVGDYPAAQIAKGIVPAVGEWMAEMAAAAIRGENEDVSLEIEWLPAKKRFKTVEVDDAVRVKTFQFTNLIPKKTVNTFKSPC